MNKVEVHKVREENRLLRKALAAALALLAEDNVVFLRKVA